MQEDDKEKRPSPESFLELIKTEGRGNLKVFLGFAPGVGKTYRMLQEAHALQKKDVAVVIGIIDAHGRKDTAALMEGLEILPPRVVDYKGMRLEDRDMDAALVRFPELLLVDELPHTNAPGGHNAKRWQDVEELLAMGINVMTTMNVQHIESLNDDIARITDVRVTETVPDKFLLTLADEIVDVDLPVDELLERLEEGKVYPKERVAEAISNFFRSHNLTALREVSLREVAKSVGARSARKAATTSQGSRDKGARERIMVAMGPYTTNARTLLRKGSRLAGELNTDWDVVTVMTPRDDERNKTIQEIQMFNDNKDLARSLGGEMVVLNGANVAHMLLDYARNNRIGRIVIGRTWRPMIERVFRESIMEHIMSEAGPIDIYVVNFDEHKISHRR